MPSEDEISVTLSRKDWGLILFTLEDSHTMSRSERKRLRDIWQVIDTRLAETLKPVKTPQ